MTTYDHVVQMVLAGNRAGDIAVALGIHTATVYEKVRQARRRGVDIPNTGVRGVKQPKRRVPVRPEVRAHLEPYAEQRGIDVIELGEILLAKICADDLVAAVLDDGSPS